MQIDLSSAEPFEIASIRPPTENQSLAFRLTRNCYWNHCAFCPVYKFGPKFSKRNFDEIKQDIERAAKLNRLLDDQVGWDADIAPAPARQWYQNAKNLIRRIDSARLKTGRIQENKTEVAPSVSGDPILSWFLQWINETPTIADSINHLLFWRLAGGKTCFLGDADSLIFKPGLMQSVLTEIKTHFSSIQRFTIYGRTATAARTRSLFELKEFRESGLNRVHFGIESGSDTVLKFVKKGETRADHLKGCLKIKDAGISCSVYVMPGLGGTQWSEAHARETASLLSDIQPDYIRLRSLEIFPKTPLAKARDNGNFLEADEDRVVGEIRTLVSEIQGNTTLLSDSASNLLDVSGRLPEDRQAMLNRIDAYLGMPERERRLFSLQARLSAFEGQYGGLSEDIYNALSPYISGGQLDWERISNTKAEQVTRQVRAKLMP